MAKLAKAYVNVPGFASFPVGSIRQAKRWTDAINNVRAEGERAGRAAEREACAKIADERAAVSREAAEKYAQRYLEAPIWAATERSAAYEAQHIAAAIRQRAEGG